MILVSYDGSSDAQAAIDRVAQLMGGAEVTVLTVWEPFADMMTRTACAGFGLAGMSGDYADTEAIDEHNSAAALVTATNGGGRATAAGLIAHPLAIRRHGGFANTILAAAGEMNADLVVLGTRGRSGVKSFLLGSVSQEVVQHADRPVLVVPSATLSEHRHDWIHAEVALYA